MNLKCKNSQYLNYRQYDRKSFIFFLLFVFIILLNSTGISISQIRSKNVESRIKASYIYNFTKFVYWNSMEGGLPENIIYIYLLGGDSIYNILEEYSKKQSGNHPIIVKKIDKITIDIKECNMLFIGESEQHNLSLILKQLDGAKVLTVSDIPGFAHKGGMIGFINVNEKIRIEINLNMTLKAGLKISAKFLEVAKIL
jgi:hypothetical protein